MARPPILDQLERYAWYEMGRQVVAFNGCIWVLGRNGYLEGTRWGEEVTVYEVLQGLEVMTAGHRWNLLRNYRAFRNQQFHARESLPFSFIFDRYDED
jgi:hypothetical protein